MNRTVSRRGFLAGAGAALLAACSGGSRERAAVVQPTGESTATPIAAPTRTPTPEPTLTPEPTPTATPIPQPLARLNASQVEQGGMLFLRVDHAAQAEAWFLQRAYRLSLHDGGSLQAYLAVYQWDPFGAASVIVSMTSPEGLSVEATLPVEVIESIWVRENIDLEPGQESLLDPAVVEEEQIKIAGAYSQVTPEVLWRGPFVQPAFGEHTSPFGELRSFNNGPISGSHGGHDIANEEGTPIFASNDGIVVLAEPLVVRGNAVIVDHGAGVFTGYYHLSQIQTQVGQPVIKGQQIGLMGATGLVTGPHLHWEVAINGVLVDGMRMMATPPALPVG